MILSKLTLQNFKRYRNFTIEFQEGLIGIIGKNGSGKSTIFEAILFALYGELKNKKFKESIRNSNTTVKDHVLVELEFEIDNITYKVVREFRGKTLSANAKFFKNGELQTTGVKEVTASIVHLTKMSKDAFLHTLFASQKELTSLSSLKNEDRKKMIRKLLGLEKIDFIEKELVDKSRELKREITAFDEVLLSSEDLKNKQILLTQNKKNEGIYTKELNDKDKVLHSIKQEEINQKKELEEFKKLQQSKQKFYLSLELLKNSITSQTQNRLKQIQDLSELEVKQKEIDKLSDIKQKYITVQTNLKEQEILREYHIKKEALIKEQKNLREQYTKSKSDIKILEKDCVLYDKHIFDLKNLEQNISILQDNIVDKQTIEKEQLAQIAGEQKIIDETNKKISKIQNLGKDSACPTCTRPLLEEYDNVINSLNEIVQKTHQTNIDKFQIQLKHVQEQKSEFELQKRQKDKQYQELSNLINLIKSKQKDLRKAQEHFSLVEEKGIKNKNELKVLEKYSYDESIHKTLKDSFNTLEPKYKYLLTLETMVKRVGTIKKEITSIDKNIEELNISYNNQEIESKLIKYDEVEHKNLEVQFSNTIKKKEEQTTVLNDIKVQIAKIQGEIKTIQNSIDENDKQLLKVQTKKDDLLDYDKIKVSLSEFKTKLNSKIAPRISDIASQIYAAITKGKYQYIEVSNDFDFYIYDEGRKFPIERFSGGEIDLANLVLRIAISKTLAELSGSSSVGFLAFDEVFGSQDESRRMEILEAFHTIKEQYRQIFLISHEIEIKEMFERVVEL
ncbi:MAG: SMC family ATPase [Campylobacterota bacterium]|nr:SMC family ATPase [Campylobacterota bacterium]